MSEHPIVRVVPGLRYRWEIQVNPDGSKTLLVREGLRFTAGAADMINDLYADRAQIALEHPVCVAQRVRRGTPNRSALITRIIRDLTAEHRVLIACADTANAHAIIDDLFRQIDEDGEPPGNATCA